MKKTNFDADLTQQIQNIDKQKMPERDLWSGIEIALAHEDADRQIVGNDRVGLLSSSRFRGLALAASMASVGVLSWYAIQQPSAPTYNGQELVLALSDQHEAQKNALLVKFAEQPALTQNWEKQLQELDDAAVAIKAALKQDPNNVALLKMLQNVHQQQIDLIERVHSPKFRQI